jgi:MOSC domain-containing protein YiiM
MPSRAGPPVGGAAGSPVHLQPIDEVVIGPRGLHGDEGFLSRALYVYAFEHYAFWQTVRAQARVAEWGQVLPFGGMGEHLTMSGLLEAQVWVGDVLQFSGCALAVSEPGLPSVELNAAMGFEQASRLMAQSGWGGFYLAVREPGVLRSGESCELLPGPREVNIRDLFRARMGANHLT